MITKYRYDFYFEAGFYKVFTVCVLICGISFLLTFQENDFIKYGSLAILAIFSLVFSYIQLDKAMDIKESIGKIFKRKK
jgi:uncharacterized membrane protein